MNCTESPLTPPYEYNTMECISIIVRIQYLYAIIMLIYSAEMLSEIAPIAHPYNCSQNGMSRRRSCYQSQSRHQTFFLHDTSLYNTHTISPLPCSLPIHLLGPLPKSTDPVTPYPADHVYDISLLLTLLGYVKKGPRLQAA